MRLRRIGVVPRTYRNIQRYRQILGILLKHGYGSLLDRLNLLPLVEHGRRILARGEPGEEDAPLTDYGRLRSVLEELGPTFIKMGQILSTRPDLVPVELMEEMERLQDRVPPFPFAVVREIVELDTRAPLETTFPEFDETPLAAASIGQVHRARLASGDEVIVKVQRPGIRAMVRTDLEILDDLAGLIERYVEESRIYRPRRIVAEFSRTLEREMDFTVEAAHAERFARQFEGNPTLHVPKVFRECTTERILVMEFVEGIKASDIAALDTNGCDRRLIASRANNLTLEQIFLHGFFHADPHPGNILVLPGNVLCYVDFGMMGRVDRVARRILADILWGYVHRDARRITDACIRLVEWDEEPDVRALESDILEFTELHLYRPLSELRIGDILKETMSILVRHRLKLPPDVYLMIKALSEAEGLGLKLCPDFDLAEEAAPFMRRLMRQRLSPRPVMDDLLATGESLIRLLRVIPGDVREIIAQIKQGRSRIVVEHEGLEHLRYEIDRASNRIAFAMIIGALVIGSSLIITTHLGPYLFGYSLPGLLGFTIAALLGVWLLVSILRSGRL